MLVFISRDFGVLFIVFLVFGMEFGTFGEFDKCVKWRKEVKLRRSKGLVVWWDGGVGVMGEEVGEG